MDTLEKLKSKHERKFIDPFPDDDLPEETIKDPVDLLLAYIKTCSGFTLVMQGGKPVLHFNPGVCPDDGERWSQACQASQLMMAAADGLKDRIRRRKLKLLSHPGY